MRIYVVVQHTERSAYTARRIRRWVRRSFRLADFLLNTVIGAAALTAVTLCCLVDGMDELLFLKMLFACLLAGCLAAAAKMAIAPVAGRKPAGTRRAADGR